MKYLKFALGLLLSVCIFCLTACSDDKDSIPTTKPTTGGGNTSKSENRQVNEWMHEQLKANYLWNDEYKQEITDPDFEQEPKEFLTEALTSLSTNTLDYKHRGTSEASIYSYIYQLPEGTATRSDVKVAKRYNYGYGLVDLNIGLAELISGNQYYATFELAGVYPDSPMAEAGLKRGDFIMAINDTPLTVSINSGGYVIGGNVLDFFYTLFEPTEAGTKLDISYLTRDYTTGQLDQQTRQCSITSKWMAYNPVLHHHIYSIDSHRIGYLVYSEFEASYDDVLFDVFKEFKSESVTDLVLDLRCNGGGYVTSANLIATCIAGTACQGKVFERVRYNKSRMEELRKDYDDWGFSYSKYDNLSTSLEAGFLNLTKIYVLVSNSTASASELVINSLRGIDIEVILIGETTNGKNVGMEVVEKKIEGHQYEFAPITFQSYNAKNFTDYDQGFTPEILLEEDQPEGLGKDQHLALRDWGKLDPQRENKYLCEPLFTKAVEEITDIKPWGTYIEQPATRGTTAEHKGFKVKGVEKPRRLGTYGMLRHTQP